MKIFLLIYFFWKNYIMFILDFGSQTIIELLFLKNRDFMKKLK